MYGQRSLAARALWAPVLDRRLVAAGQNSPWAMAFASRAKERAPTNRRVQRQVLLRLGAAEADMAVHTRAGEVQRTLHLMLVFGQHVGADDLGCLQIAAAIEAGRVIRIADTIVDGRLRIRAERALHGPARGLRQNLVRRHPMLHPFHERPEEVLRLGPAAATAVPDAGRPEQPIEALQFLEVRSLARAVAEARRHLPIVVNDAARHDQLVVAPDERHQLAAMAPEHVEIV